MELTLTGASLNSDKAKPVAAGKVASTKSCEHNHKHSHSHDHVHKHDECQHDKKCCDKHPANPAAKFQSLESIPLEKLLSNEGVLFSAILTAIKGGSFESFQYLVDAVLDHEQKGNVLKWGTPVGTNSNNDSTGTGDDLGNMKLKVKEGSICTSALGRRWNDGHTLIHWTAKRRDDVRFIRYIADKVSNIDLHVASNDQVGMTPLHWAATEGSIPIVNFILQHLDKATSSKMSLEVPIDARDKSGCTPLLIAAQYGHADLAAFLIKRGADPNAVDNSKDTALHWAAYKGAVPVCGLLLHLNGIRGHVDSKDSFGQTPLHLASLRGNVAVIIYILEQAEGYALGIDEEKTSDERPSEPNFSQEIHDDKNEIEGIDLMEGPISLSDRANFPMKLLTLQDREGKTPLGLAIKKNKTNAEMILREFMEKHCQENKPVLQRVISMLKQFFSLKSWLHWIGLVNDGAGGGTPPKFIFWFVATNIVLAFLYDIIVYIFDVNVFGSVASTSDHSKPRLYDYTALHVSTMTSFLLTMTFFILVNRTDPGLLAKKHTASIEPKGVFTALSNIFLCCWIFNAENKRIKREMHTLTNDLRALYETTLESFASTSDHSSEKKDKIELQLCHSCHIARPLRSKHCRVLNRCVLLFDHHCPFVGTTVGLYNYKYFYLFVVWFTITEVLFGATGYIYLKKGYTEGGLEVGKMLVALYFSIYTAMTLGLTVYHTQLVHRNLTTNEHQNIFRYAYLKNESGAFKNPFNRGFMKNLMSRFNPKRDAYTIEECIVIDDSINTVLSSETDAANKKSDDERVLLIENKV